MIYLTNRYDYTKKTSFSLQENNFLQKVSFVVPIKNEHVSPVKQRKQIQLVFSVRFELIWKRFH